MTIKKILSFKTRRPERLRDIPFTESYCMGTDINDLVYRYMQELTDSVIEYETGKLSGKALHTLLKRAMYACYKRGITDGRDAARAERVIKLSTNKRPKSKNPNSNNIE